MIQFNLLPDVKLAFMQAERQKRLVITISIVASIVSLIVLFFLVVSVKFVQVKSINDLTKDTQTATTKLEEIDDIDKILTVQNQLDTLTSLHDGKTVGSRAFLYISQVTPTDASINNLKLDFATSSLEITGLAGSLSTVNKYVDTLKFTRFALNKGDEETPAFTSVVLSSFASTSTSTSFTITTAFDPVIFSIANDAVELTVPNIITTHSEVSNATSLFQSSGAN